jgi:hypothetical protein
MANLFVFESSAISKDRRKGLIVVSVSFLGEVGAAKGEVGGPESSG